MQKTDNISYLIGAALAAVVLWAIFSAGCASMSGEDWDALYRAGYDAVNDIGLWDKVVEHRNRRKAEKSPETPEQPGNSKPLPGDEKPAPPQAVSDYADYSSFNWKYGGFNGAKATYDPSVEIGSLKFNGRDGLALKWVKGLSAWGVAHTDHTGALACLFVKDSSGQWVGGKFDWISTSRSTRDFKNVFAGYNGWSLSGVPNPTDAALVIVRANGKQRSNVIGGEWRR
jgi:hypothetical protein